jgi:hypothetical protein
MSWKHYCLIFGNLFCFWTFSIFPDSVVKEYTIVLDPGHGGVHQVPFEIYGDKYDVVTDRYLENYKSGAQYKTRTEMEIVLEIAKEVQNILELTRTKNGFRKFRSLIKLFSHTNPTWIKFRTVMTRTDNVSDRVFREKEDKNADYRLFDFKDFETGEKRLGRISKINREKPYLLVSFHINSTGTKSTGMGAVLSPSFRTFNMLRNISLGRATLSEFNQSPWKNWIRFNGKWTNLENAIADSWIYFHGYLPNQTLDSFNIKKFEGFRQNMVTWKYADIEDWHSQIGKPGPYSKKMTEFSATGNFWEREKSSYEMYRREDGIEGFGGDNYYAGMELLRYVQYALRTEQTVGGTPNYGEPGPILKPFISTYALPTFVNAICAYLELGDIAIDRDIYYLTAKRKRMAIGIAVGIYSLFQGLEPKIIETPYIPIGKKIDFSKYITNTDNIYFNEVIE